MIMERMNEIVVASQNLVREKMGQAEGEAERDPQPLLIVQNAFPEVKWRF